MAAHLKSSRIFVKSQKAIIITTNIREMEWEAERYRGEKGSDDVNDSPAYQFRMKSSTKWSTG